MNPLISKRIALARRRRGLTQDALAKALAFNGRHVISAIERNKRELTAGELTLAMHTLGVNLEFLTDRFHPAGEERFFWHATKPVAASALDLLEWRASRLTALSCYLDEAGGRQRTSGRDQLPLSITGASSNMPAIARTLARAWGLSTIPAEHLDQCISKKLGFATLSLDLPQHIASGICRAPEHTIILIDRQLAGISRSHELALALFFLLAWNLAPSQRSPQGERKKPDICFLLLAEQFATTLVAQMATSGRTRQRASRTSHKPFSIDFIQRVHQTLATGQLSIRRAASLLNLTIDGLASLFADYGLPTDIQ